MRRALSLCLAVLFLAPAAARAQTPPVGPDPKADQTQPSQRANVPAPAAKAAPVAPPKAEVYGTINVNTQWTRARSATVGSGLVLTSPTTAANRNVSPRLGVSVDSSNVGVRGGLQVTEWLKAEYQCETSAAIDGIGPSGICNRNSKIGASGAFGSVFFGNWDTPFKAAAYGTKADDPFGNTDVFDRAALIGSGGFNYRSGGWKTATADAVNGFAIRAQNSVAYWTPVFAGLQAKFQYGVNEFKAATPAGGAEIVSPKLYSASVVYNAGPASVFGAYEIHEDGFGLAQINTGAAATASRTFGATTGNLAAGHTEDSAWRVGAGYELALGTLGSLTPNFVFEQVKFLQGAGPAGSVGEYNRYAWSGSLKYRMGNHELRARYDRANDGGCELVGGAACSTADFGAQMYTVGYAFHLAKTTQIYVHATEIRNERNGQYTFSTAGVSAVTGANGVNGTTRPGQDPQALALGVRHAF